MKTAIELITEERARQISVEGWTPEHDDAHESGELAAAAACYALPDLIRQALPNRLTRIPIVESLWPWELRWWKPTPENRVRELVKAGTLIAAEIDRLQRAVNSPVCHAETKPQPKPRTP